MGNAAASVLDSRPGRVFERELRLRPWCRVLSVKEWEDGGISLLLRAVDVKEFFAWVDMLSAECAARSVVPPSVHYHHPDYHSAGPPGVRRSYPVFWVHASSGSGNAVGRLRSLRILLDSLRPFPL